MAHAALMSDGRDLTSPVTLVAGADFEVNSILTLGEQREGLLELAGAATAVDEGGVRDGVGRDPASSTPTQSPLSSEPFSSFCRSSAPARILIGPDPIAK